MHACTVCMYACMHACMHVCMWCMYACMYVMYVCMYICMCVCLYVCMFACTSCLLVRHVCMYVMYLCMVCVYISTYVCMYVQDAHSIATSLILKNRMRWLSKTHPWHPMLILLNKMRILLYTNQPTWSYRRCTTGAWLERLIDMAAGNEVHWCFRAHCW